MAWLYKRNAVWWLGWRLNGGEHRKSTGETVEAEARKHLDRLDKLESARAANALTEDFYKAATGRKLDRPTASKFLSGWLSESASADCTPSTMNKYKQVVRELSEHIEADATGLLMEDVTVEQVAGFFAVKRAKLSPGTVKGYRRILNSIFLLAQNRGLIRANPVALCKARGRALSDDSNRKRAFTLTELKTLFDTAAPFWRYMLMAGYFTGQSLGDLITMRAETVNLATGQITMHRRKTGKQVIIPISKHLRALLVSVWPDGGKGYFWPAEAGRYLKSGPSSFSSEFYALLATAGLVEKRDAQKESTGKGRNAKRAAAIGFHNVRHTFVTHLKIGGAVDSVAKELAGHGSDAVSAVYTHLPADTLAHAVNQLPEFVK